MPEVTTMFTSVFWLRLGMALTFWGSVFWLMWFYNNSDLGHNREFKLIDLLMENGRASKWSVIIMCTFGLSCVIMTAWFVNETLLWADFMTFCGIWIVPLLAKMFSNNGKGPPPVALETKEKYRG